MNADRIRLIPVAQSVRRHSPVVMARVRGCAGRGDGARPEGVAWSRAIFGRPGRAWPQAREVVTARLVERERPLASAAGEDELESTVCVGPLSREGNDGLPVDERADQQPFVEGARLCGHRRRIRPLGNGFWNTAGGYEFNLLVFAAAVAIAATGSARVLARRTDRLGRQHQRPLVGRRRHRPERARHSGDADGRTSLREADRRAIGEPRRRGCSAGGIAALPGSLEARSSAPSSAPRKPLLSGGSGRIRSGPYIVGRAGLARERDKTRPLDRRPGRPSPRAG
jgi:hypothetical protein